jgi:hypothetical protein
MDFEKQKGKQMIKIPFLAVDGRIKLYDEKEI